jgi:Ran GTPase-activating protein (RanGAP) involved in mRNA processing and transport
LADGIVELLGFRLAPADRLADAGAIGAAAQLVASPHEHVTSFLMTSHGVGDAGAAALLRALSSSCSKLTVLNMAENAITGAGAAPEGSDVDVVAALSTALAGLPKLTALCLNYNPLGDAGARALVAAVGASPFSKQLQALKLGGCALSNAGAQAIADVLAAKQLRHLTDLDLYHNNIGDLGARALADALQQSSPLRPCTVLLSRNRLSAQMVTELNNINTKGKYKFMLELQQQSLLQQLR